MAINAAGVQFGSVAPPPSLGGAPGGVGAPTFSGNPNQGVGMLMGLFTQLFQGFSGFGGGGVDPLQAVVDQRQREQEQMWNTILGARQQDLAIGTFMLQDALGQNDIQMQIIGSALPGLGGLTQGMPDLGSLFGMGGGMGFGGFGQTSFGGFGQTAFGGGFGQSSFGGFGQTSFGGFQNAGFSPVGGAGRGPAWMGLF